MKILQVCNHFYPCVGGIETIVLELSKKLKEKGHKVKVICLNACSKEKKELQKKTKIQDIEVERLNFIDLKYYKIAPHIISKLEDFQIIHVHGIGFFSDFLLLTKPFHKKKVFVSTHGGIFHTKTIGVIKKNYFNIIQKLLLKNADKVIAVSKNDFEIFKRISENTTLIENGINLKKFKQEKKEKNSFVYIGRFSQNKNIDLLLKTFSQLKDHNFKLIIAGNDQERLLEKLKKTSQELKIEKKVKFIVNPTDEQAIELYAKNEFFVSASEYEGFGITLIEAMASGCIPIVQKNNSFKHIITNKVNGFLTNFQNDEAKETIEKTMKMKTQEKQKILQEAQKKANYYSIEKMVEKIEKSYGE